MTDTIDASELTCMFITNEDAEEVTVGVCGDEATAIHSIRLIDVQDSIAIPTCEFHDGVMTGTVILREA